jgi:hypothetical protein
LIVVTREKKLYFFGRLEIVPVGVFFITEGVDVAWWNLIVVEASSDFFCQKKTLG